MSDKKEELRAAFNDPTKVVEVAMGFGFNPCLYADGFEKMLERVNDYSWRISEMLPYESYAEFLQKQKIHGPYLLPVNIQDVVVLPYYVSNSKVIVNNGNFEETLTFLDVMKYYRWQDGSFCGKIGKELKFY